MGKADLLKQGEVRSFAPAISSCRPFSDAIDRQHRRLRKATEVVGACCMGQMMIQTHHPTRVARKLTKFSERTHRIKAVEFAQPTLTYQWELRPYLSLELGDWVLVKSDAINLCDRKI